MTENTTPQATREDSFNGFARELNSAWQGIRLAYNVHHLRVCRIEAPESGGDITVVFESKEWPNRKAATYRADGRWSQLSYWSEVQI